MMSYLYKRRSLRRVDYIRYDIGAGIVVTMIFASKKDYLSNEPTEYKTMPFSKNYTRDNLIANLENDQFVTKL